MCRDCYDLELPEVKESWAVLLSENKHSVKTVALSVLIPAAILIGSLLLDYWLKGYDFDKLTTSTDSDEGT